MPPSYMKHKPRGPVIQARPDFCPYCDGRELIKRGLRRNLHRHLQMYWCQDCTRYFTPLAGVKGAKYPPRVMARALCLYNLGHSQAETARRIAAEHRITVPRRTIADWISAFRCITTFERLRAAAVTEFRSAMLKGRSLRHQQVYQYKVHMPKLALAATMIAPNIAAQMTSYLLSVFEDFPDVLFQENADDDSLAEAAPLRSSKSRFEILPLSRTEKQNLANDLAALGLLLARRNKDRHASVQDFMLANDSCTIACEVPVYLTSGDIARYKCEGLFIGLPESTKAVTGHIDVLQARNGFIHLLDYKPGARQIDPVNQLVIYALAFAARTGLPLKVLKCAWFDEKDYFEFFPLEAVSLRLAPEVPSDATPRTHFAVREPGGSF